MVGLFGMGKELYSFGTVPNEMSGSSIGALLRDGEVREKANKILTEARSEIEALLREKSIIVEGVRDALLEHEEILGEEIEKLRRARNPQQRAKLYSTLRSAHSQKTANLLMKPRGSPPVAWRSGRG
ncbi:MAG: hypothetical protein LC740_07805 [Actinobacteria bacterium]|nr:hypothetical protein [Actinomycetota bacterium]